MEKSKKVNLNRFYPFFFTIVLIAVILQYSFSSLEAVFYDARVKLDWGISSQQQVVLVTLDEESNKFLGENAPYSYATHARFIERLIKDDPAIISYLVSFEEPFSNEEKREIASFRSSLLGFIKKGGLFRFGTDMDIWGERLPPKTLRDLGYSLALHNVDGPVFAKDDVCRRAILDTGGEDTLHLWLSNKYRQLHGDEKIEPSQYYGSYYLREADATFTLFRYPRNSVKNESDIKSIPFHRVVVGNFPKNYFKDKIVLVGNEYISNSSDFILTPFNKEKYTSSKLNVHASIIEALIQNKTIFQIPIWISNVLAIVLGLALSFGISRLQPAKGLFLTLTTLVGLITLSFIMFSAFGLWLYITHLIFAVFIVYYIWIPFRAINEYQTRYKFEEEAKLLKKVDSLKQNFISLMSHDLKTPVAKIAGLADNLKHTTSPTPEQVGNIDNIMESTKELNHFITSILDLTKVESQNINLQKSSKDINKIIESVVDNLTFQARRNQISIETQLSPLYPIKIDPVLIKRVISNLAENAIKYAGEESVITIITEDDEKWVYVKISDNGRGIPQEDLENIFEKFYRVKNDAVHTVKGSGLGLYLVKYFVELHDGTIEAQSEVGKGVTFTIKLKNQ